MQPQNICYNLSNRFKILVFLSGSNNERSVRFVNHFAKSLEVLYITPDHSNLDALNEKNIEVYCYKGILEKLGTISPEILANRVGAKIKKVFNEREIDEYDAYFFLNSMTYASLFKSTNFYAHFDFVEEMKDIYVTDFHKFDLINKIKSVSTMTTRNSKMLEPYMSPIFKIFDGVEIDEQVNEYKQDERPIIGCYMEDFNIINPFYINELAALNPGYNLIFCSRNASEIKFNFKSNIKFLSQPSSLPAFDYIVFPFEKENPYEINKIFYMNLKFDKPMLAIQSQEISFNECFVNMYRKKAELILALKNTTSIKSTDYLQREILKQNIDWETRLKQLESIILAYS